MRFIGLFDVETAGVAASVGLGVALGSRNRQAVFLRGIERFGPRAVGTEDVHYRREAGEREL